MLVLSSFYCVLFVVVVALVREVVQTLGSTLATILTMAG
jgi:hypothetical protein